MKKILIVIFLLFAMVGYANKNSAISVIKEDIINTPDTVKLNVVHIPQSIIKKFYGIGAMIEKSLNGFEIIDLIPNGPSKKILKLKDLIIAVDKKSIIGMNTLDVIELIKGEKNSSFARYV